MYNLKKIAPATYLMEKEPGMNVPGLIIATEELMQGGDFEKPLGQVRNVPFYLESSAIASRCPIFIGDMGFRSAELLQWIPIVV